MSSYIAVMFVWDGDLGCFASTTTGFEAGIPKVGDRIWITRSLPSGKREVPYSDDPSKTMTEYIWETTPPCEVIVLEVAKSLEIAYTRDAKREHDMRPENADKMSHCEIQVRVMVRKVDARDYTAKDFAE